MRKLTLAALALLLALPTVGLNARSADALSTTTAEPTRSAVQLDMLQTLNDHRASVGAPTIGADARVNAASQNHANYSSANNYMGHYETSGLPYYTGYSARDRRPDRDRRREPALGRAVPPPRHDASEFRIGRLGLLHGRQPVLGRR